MTWRRQLHLTKGSIIVDSHQNQSQTTFLNCISFQKWRRINVIRYTRTLHWSINWCKLRENTVKRKKILYFLLSIETGKKYRSKVKMHEVHTVKSCMSFSWGCWSGNLFSDRLRHVLINTKQHRWMSSLINYSDLSLNSNFSETYDVKKINMYVSFGKKK